MFLSNYRAERAADVERFCSAQEPKLWKLEPIRFLWIKGEENRFALFRMHSRL